MTHYTEEYVKALLAERDSLRTKVRELQIQVDLLTWDDQK